RTALARSRHPYRGKPVTTGHIALGLKVGEKGEMEFTIARECSVAPGAIDGNSDKLRAQVAKILEHFIVERHLIAAHRTPVCGIKSEHHILSPKIADIKPLVWCAAQAEIGCLRSGGQRTAPSFYIKIVVILRCV